MKSEKQGAGTKATESNSDALQRLQCPIVSLWSRISNLFLVLMNCLLYKIDRMTGVNLSKLNNLKFVMKRVLHVFVFKLVSDKKFN